MKNIKLTTPVVLPKGTISIINPDLHLVQLRTPDDLFTFAAILHDLYSANEAYSKLMHIGGPDILLFRSYQKLQNAVWRLFDRFPALNTERKDHHENKGTIHRSGDLF